MNPAETTGATPATLSSSGRVAVVILTINQREQSLRCLEHLLDSESESVEFDVLVWDNGSSDGTATEVAREFPGVLVKTSHVNLGVAGGRNAAAAAAREAFGPDFLLFLDNDIVIMPGFISALKTPFFEANGDRVGQTQAKLRLADAPERINDGGGCKLQLWLGRSRPVGFGEIDRGQFDSPRPCISCGGAMMVRTSVFEHLGGFDESFNPFGPEDIDFSLRLKKAGLEAWYVPGAVARHDVNHSFGAGYSEDYARYRARHWMCLMRRHARLLDWLGFVAIGVPLITLRVLVREGRRRNLGAIRGLVRGALQRK